jgi:hypothetical protein
VNVYRHSRLCEQSRVGRHRKSPSCDGFNHWSIRAGCFTSAITEDVHLLDVPKESLSRSGRAGSWTRVNKMALTFGTLLSSQGADAHRHDPFGAIRGNLNHITRSVPRGQTRPALPGLPLGRGDSRRVRCLVLGGKHPPVSTRPLASRRGPFSWLRLANKENISQPSRSVQVPGPDPCSPVFSGF